MEQRILVAGMNSEHANAVYDDLIHVNFLVHNGHQIVASNCLALACQ